MAPFRIIAWSTGHVGLHALRGIIRHPDMELAGLWVHSPEKVGRDAGELAGVTADLVRAVDPQPDELHVGVPDDAS